jgi:hypothetical protein
MTVTWRQQIVVYCVLMVARMFADDAQLVQDLRNLSNRITTQQPIGEPGATATPVAARPGGEFLIESTPT